MKQYKCTGINPDGYSSATQVVQARNKHTAITIFKSMGYAPTIEVEEVNDKKIVEKNQQLIEEVKNLSSILKKQNLMLQKILQQL